MSSALTRLSRVSSAIAISFALAAAPAAAAGYLKLGDIKGEAAAAGSGHSKEIHVESFSWGATQARVGGKMHQEDISVAPASGARAGNVEREMTESGEKGGTEDINIGVGELQEATISKSTDRTIVPLAQHALIGRAPRGTARRASLSVQVPAGTCRPGARYPTAELGADGRIYTMTGVVVARCSPARARDGSIPTETLSLNFDKITWK